MFHVVIAFLDRLMNSALEGVVEEGFLEHGI